MCMYVRIYYSGSQKKRNDCHIHTYIHTYITYIVCALCIMICMCTFMSNRFHSREGTVSVDDARTVCGSLDLTLCQADIDEHIHK